MSVFEVPVSLNVIAQLVQIPPNEYFELFRKSESLGWVYQNDDGSFSLSNNLPDNVRIEIEKINTPAKLATLVESIKANNLIDKIPPKAFKNILQKSKAEKINLKDEMALAIEALTKGNRRIAKIHIEKIDLLLASFEENSPENVWFISKSIKLAEHCIRRACGLSTASKMMEKTIIMAEGVGDERSWAMANFLLGRACWFKGWTNEAILYLGRGKEKAEALGDPDILTYSALFIGIYYTLLGYMNKAADYLKAVTQSAIEREDLVLKYEAPVNFLYCDINRGDFHRAIGTIDFFRRLAIKKKDHDAASVYQVMLGIALWAIGKREEALFHLEGVRAVAPDNMLGYWMSLHGLSCLYLGEGDIDKGLSLFKQVLSLAGKAEIVHQVFHPLYFESYFKAEQAGCDLPAGWHFDELFQKIMAGQNVDLQGTALRLRAVKSIAAGKPEKMILKDLQESEALLVKCEDSFQLAKTKIEMVRYYLRNNNYEKARKLANQVYYQELTGYNERFFPDDLGFLLEETKSEAGTTIDYGPSLEPILRILEELFTAPDDAMKMDLFLSTLSRFFKAERSGIFIFDKADAAELRTARNLSRSIIHDLNFLTSMDMIVTCYKKRKPMLSKNIKEAGGARLYAMCLPIFTEMEVKAVLYFDNSYLANCFDFVSMPMLESLGRNLDGILKKQEIFAKNTTGLLEHALPNIGDVLGAPSNSSDLISNIIIKDMKMIKLFKQARRLAESEAPILILGETGSGKEILAQWIHRKSLRREKPFVIIDLTTIPENLMESELFGHEKGAFTGAYHQKIGRVELAEGGTLFFDEIGEIPLSLQVKLLRLLEQQTFTRVGGTKVKRAQFRFLAATNRNLIDEVKAGRFREDLYYRINALELTIPPLRERRDDIAALANHFLVNFAKKYKKKISALTEEQETAIKNYYWPGNVRELKHFIERAVLIAEDARVELVFSNQSSERSPVENVFSGFPTMDEIQRRYIQLVLDHVNGKIRGAEGAAEILEMNPSTLISRMKNLGMR